MESLRECVLPSNGYLTNGVKVFNLDAIGFDQEKKIFSSATEQALDEVLQECIKEPKDFDVTTLTEQDRQFLLFQLRIHSYGDDYHVKVGGKEYVVSLENMDIIELEEGDATIKGKLPMAGDEFTIQFPTVGQIRKIKRYAEEKSQKLHLNYGDLYYEALKASTIGEINGEHKDTTYKVQWLKTLKGRDLAYIDHVSKKAKYGYTGTVPVELEDGSMTEATVRMTGEFFRPRFDD